MIRASGRTKKKRAISNMMQLPGGVDNSHGGEKQSFSNLRYATFPTKGHKAFWLTYFLQNAEPRD